MSAMATGKNPFYIYNIVEVVFQYLPGRDLCICASVCKLWNDISTEELRRRRRVAWIFQGIECHQHNVLHPDQRNYSIDKVTDFRHQLEQKLRNVHIKPSSCIVFATAKLLECFEVIFPVTSRDETLRKQVKLDFTEETPQNILKRVIQVALRNHLPPNCQVDCYVSGCIFTTPSTAGDRRIVVNSDGIVIVSTPALGIYLFPEFYDGELKFLRKTESNWTLPDYKKLSVDVKGILAPIEHKYILDEYLRLYTFINKMIGHRYSCTVPIPLGSEFLPLFCGPKVETVALQNQDESVLEDLVEKGFFKTQTIGFYFSGRLPCAFIFKKVNEMFPNIPFFGFIGIDKITSKNDDVTLLRSSWTTTRKYYNLFLVSFKNFQPV